MILKRLIWPVALVGVAIFAIYLASTISDRDAAVMLEDSESEATASWPPLPVEPKTENYVRMLRLSEYPSEVAASLSADTFQRLQWKMVIFKEGDVETSYRGITAQYPQFESTIPSVQNFNAFLKKFIEDTIASERSMSERMTRDYPGEQTHVSLQIKSSVTGIVHGIASVEITIISYTGGGNGNHEDPLVMNYDLKHDRMLTNREIFCRADFLSVLSPIARGIILRDFQQQEPPLILDQGMIDWIAAGTQPNGEAWRNISLTQDGIIAVFQPYTVTSGAQGVVRATIPNSEIPGVLCLP